MSDGNGYDALFHALSGSLDEQRRRCEGRADDWDSILNTRVGALESEFIKATAAYSLQGTAYADQRDRLSNLAGVQAHRFDLLGGQVASLHAKVDSLMALIEAKPKRKARR